MGLKKVVESSVPPPFEGVVSSLSELKLIPRIEKFVSRGGYHDERAPGYHVSQMYKFCARKAVLDWLYPERVKPEEISTGLQMIFDVGHALHEWFQNRYLGPAGILKGKWECLRCELHVKGFMPEHCPGCGGPQTRFRYLEPIVRDDSLDLIGHTDGIIQVGDEEQVLELKTINPNAFLGLRAPQPAHIFQVNIYMHLLEKDYGTIVYINKATSELKEFLISYNHAIWNEVEGKLGAVLRFKNLVKNNGGIVNPAWIMQVPTICPYREWRAAQECSQADPCFDMREKGLSTIEPGRLKLSFEKLALPLGPAIAPPEAPCEA